MEIKYDVDLKDLNTFGISVKASALASFNSLAELLEIINTDSIKALPRMILGGGSNILFTKNFEGLVLKNDIKGIEELPSDADFHYIKVGAGENWHQLVLYTLQKGYSGLENLSLIPGNVGASPMQNIGAYGIEIKDRFHTLEALNLITQAAETFEADKCNFGYRDSIFKNEAKGRYIILSVTFKLPKQGEFNIAYGAIRDELQKTGVSDPKADDISRAVIKIRNSKLPDPKVLGNAGSFFKNPIVAEPVWKQLQLEHPEIPHYPAKNGMVKLAAGWLIEQAGWKGKKVGRCGMHAKQALVLVNYGGATGRELLDLSQQVIDSVFAKFGVRLESEVNVI